jgi:hypothetical protein
MKGAACAAAGVVALGAAIFWHASGDARTGAQGRADAAAPVVATPAPPVVVSTPLPPHIRAGAVPGLPAGAASSGQPAAAHPSGDELFAYSTTDTPHREGPYTFYPVDIDVDQVLASALSGRLTFTAPDGSQISLDYDRHLTHEDGNWTWMGRETGGTASQDAVITFGPDATYGSLPSSNGQQLRITTIQGKTYVASASFSQLQPGIRPGGDTVVKAADSAVSGASANGSVVAAAASSTASPVDVVIGYSTGYRTYLGSASAVTTRLTNLVDVANRGLANSAVTTAAFRLVGSLEVNYADNTDNGVALTDLASTSSSSPLAAMRAARAQYGADMVSFMRRYSTEQNGCGLAYIPQAPYASTGRDQTFSVVGDGSIDLGGGAYSYCPDTSLAHEMGHNLGAQHNAQTNSTGGLYAYSYGYRNDSANYYDIMSYGLNGQEAELLYSTPDVSTCKGLPCGVANSADVARTFRETLAVAMAFRATVVADAGANAPGQLTLANGTGRCLDAVNGGVSNGTPLQMWACNGLRQQQWGVQAATRAVYSLGTSLVLDVTGYSTSPGAAIQLWTGGSTANQAWTFTHASLAVSNSGRVLDAIGYGTANGTLFQLYDDNRTSNQRFTFDPSVGELVSDTGRCLDVQGYGTANGTRVQLWDCTHTENQKWKLGPNGSIVGYGGNCLEAADGGTSSGTVVRMWQCNAQPHQKWRIRGEVRGVQSNLCLDDPAGGLSNGTRPQMYTCLGNDHQRWEYQPN